MSTAAARNWQSLIDLEEIGLEDRYYAALCSLAAYQANEKQEQQTEGEGEEQAAPDISEPEEVIAAVTNGKAPDWWPDRIDRLSVLVKVKPEGSTPENLGPHPLDPNTTAGDLGLGTFIGMLKGMLEMAGTPFEGTLQVRIQRRSDRSILGGWKGAVYVGEKEKKEKGKKGGRDDEGREDMFDYLTEKLEKQDEAMLRMFQNSSNVIHASASAINAMRGANVAPPWMNGAGGEEEPFWMTLARGAADVVVKAGLENQTPQQVAGQVMRQPVRPRQPGIPGPNYQQHQLPGPTADEPDLGYSEYMEEGDFDGYRASEGDLIDDDFEDDDGEYEDDDGEYEDEDDDDDFDIYEAGFEDSGEAFEDPLYDDPESEPRGRKRRRRSKRSSNPLEGLSPDELAAHLGDYIDKNPDKKGQLKGLALGMAKKIL